jgi:hypothetical protein
MRERLRLLALFLGAGLAAACTEPLGPDGVLGGYALQAVAGQPLPAVVDSSSDFIVRVLADTLRLGNDGRGARVRIAEYRYPTGIAPTDTVRWDGQLGFRIVEGRIEMTFVCPADALCVAPPHIVAWRTSDGLRSSFDLGQRVPQDYRRLASAP